MTKTKIKQYFTPSRLFALAALVILVAVSMSQPLSAQSLSQGYATDQPLQRGMIVKLKDDDATKVEPVQYSNMDKTYGVVVNPNDAPVTLSDEGNKVFVSKIGHFAVLVNDQNGPIVAGDYITISSISGIGMKATTNEPIVVGRALDAFDGQAGVISTSSVKDSAGVTRDIHIGRISGDLGINRNPNLKSTEPNLPEFLRRAAENLAGKPVSTTKAYIGVVIFLISATIAGALMYSGVRNGIISIGRNPLSKRSIIRGMVQVILTGLIVFLTGIFGVYLLLKL